MKARQKDKNNIKIKGVVLAGGESRRFGSNKARALYRGATLLDRSVGLLKENQIETALVANSTQDYSKVDCMILRDKIPGKGPLGGLYTAMLYWSDRPLLVLTCDMPALSGDVIKNLIKKHSKKNKITVYEDKDLGTLPFPGIYDPILLSEIENRLKNERLSMKELISSAGAKKLDRSGFCPEVFSNINKCSDLDAFHSQKS